jgi:hypothetical protein
MEELEELVPDREEIFNGTLGKQAGRVVVGDPPTTTLTSVAALFSENDCVGQRAHCDFASVKVKIETLIHPGLVFIFAPKS